MTHAGLRVPALQHPSVQDTSTPALMPGAYALRVGLHKSTGLAVDCWLLQTASALLL